jgi:spore maturation protein CgeB
VNILYSFNKTGYEAKCWDREIRKASNERYTFIPFNHGDHLDPCNCLDAVQLDRLYQTRYPELMGLYHAFEATIETAEADAIIVTNAPPYHPDFLRKFPGVYKVLYSGDDPGATYMRNIPYLHAYQHVMYMAPGYSRDMDLGEKMRYCGMVNVDWVPISVFDFEFESARSETELFRQQRDIDIVYVGGFFPQKLDLLAKLKKVFGRRLQIHGFFKLKHNLYYNIKYGFPGWVRPVSFQERVKLYQRAKLGFNIHWNEYGLGNQRLFHLPANGVMQLCDCPELLDRVFRTGEEVIGYTDSRDLTEKLHYYLENETERERVAANGCRRVMRDYRFAHVTRDAGAKIERGMARINWRQ